VPDPEWGEALKAVVVIKPGAKIGGAELQQFCKERLSSYKVPKSVEFVESLPHTEVGKVNKVKVREMFVAQA
jgi:long-chain acyl-CoA synthetase